MLMRGYQNMKDLKIGKNMLEKGINYVIASQKLMDLIEKELKQLTLMPTNRLRILNIGMIFHLI